MGGAYFFSASWHERLLLREKPGFDGARPSGNSIEAFNLLRLSAYTSDAGLRQNAERIFARFSNPLMRSSHAFTAMLFALDFYYDEPAEIVVVKSLDQAASSELMRVLAEFYLPNRVLAVFDGPQSAAFGNLIPWVSGKIAENDQETAYVCKRKRCSLPTQDPVQLKKTLSSTLTRIPNN